MDVRSLFILGRQAAIGLAELESLYGSNEIYPLNAVSAYSSLPATAIDFERLGSTIKLADYIETLPSTRWQDIQSHLPAIMLRCADNIREGKLQIGLSSYGFNILPRQLTATGLGIKKQLRSEGYSVRLVPNKEMTLNSAQVLHNNLTGRQGIELLIIRSEGATIIGKTRSVQNIEAYAQRDQVRPKRDPLIGMLPPKLAQSIINLAVGQIPKESKLTVLDPFCGTGVILQEAALMGYKAYGSDLEPRMVEYAHQNLSWLAEKVKFQTPILEIADATTHLWRHQFNVLASETYLGQPLRTWPDSEELNTIVSTCDLLITKFLQNISNQLPKGSRMCLALPAWISPNNRFVKHLPVLDRLEFLGYNRVSFRHVALDDLVYYRPGQLVGRELLVLKKK